MKQLQIECPEGYEIDQVNSDLKNGIVKFKKLGISNDILTYEDLAFELFKDKGFYLDGDNICEFENDYEDTTISSTDSTTKEQLESILALNKLCNVAKYLNGNWIPNCKDANEPKYYIFIDFKDNKLYISSYHSTWGQGVMFRSEEIAKKAINILGEGEIKKALLLDY